MDYFVENWSQTVAYEKLVQTIQGRRLYIYGAFSNGKYVREQLAEQGIDAVAFIDGHKEEAVYDGLPICKMDQHHIRPDDSYIVVAVNGVRNEILDRLNQSGFIDHRDYLYIYKDVPKFTLVKSSGHYKDIYDNEIISSGDVCATIELIGWHNRVEIGDGFICGEKSYIRASFGSHIIIGDYVNLGSDGEIESVHGLLKIGSNCQMDRDFRICQKGADVALGDYLSIGKRFLCLGGKTASVIVGDDCMISNDVSLIASGGHSIFDLSKKVNMSLTNERHVIIGNHVWLGQGVSVVHNSEISDGCVVGANALVKCKAGKNSIIAGNPASVIHENCTWDRRLGITYDEL